MGCGVYASVTDLRRIFLAVSMAAALIPLVLWMFRVSAVVPRSVLIINPVLIAAHHGRQPLRVSPVEGARLYSNLKLHGEPVLCWGGRRGGQPVQGTGAQPRLAAGRVS